MNDSLQKPHDRGEHFLPRQTRQLQVLSNSPANIRKGFGELCRAGRTCFRRALRASARDSGTACGHVRRDLLPECGHSVTDKSTPQSRQAEWPNVLSGAAAARRGLFFLPCPNTQSFCLSLCELYPGRSSLTYCRPASSAASAESAATADSIAFPFRLFVPRAPIEKTINSSEALLRMPGGPPICVRLQSAQPVVPRDAVAARSYRCLTVAISPLPTQPTLVSFQ